MYSVVVISIDCTVSYMYCGLIVHCNSSSITPKRYTWVHSEKFPCIWSSRKEKYGCASHLVGDTWQQHTHLWDLLSFLLLCYLVYEACVPHHVTIWILQNVTFVELLAQGGPRRRSAADKIMLETRLHVSCRCAYPASICRGEITSASAGQCFFSLLDTLLR